MAKDLDLVPRITRLRHQRRIRADHSLIHRLKQVALAGSLLIALLAALMILGITAGYAVLVAGLPSPEILPALLESPNSILLQPTRLYDRSGEHLILSIENPAAETREYLSLGAITSPKDSPTTNPPNQQDGIPATLENAIIATADPTFWNHPGVTWIGSSQGRKPTLAQRLASGFMLWDEPPGIRRSLRERLLAAQITKLYGREKVLEWYLNSANFGQLSYGVDAAAHTYLGKSASEVTLAEAATIAAVAEAPALNPINAPQAALERKDQTLQTMLGLGLISAEQYQQAIQEQVHFSPAQANSINLAPAFSNLVLEQLTRFINLDRLARGGFRVITTLDYDLQLQTDCVVEAQNARLKGPQTTDPVAADGSSCRAAQLLPTLPNSAIDHGINVDVNVVITDPASGHIIAMVGDPTPNRDPAHPPGHAPGSILTPMIYLTAFTRGMGPASLIWDIPANLPSNTAGLRNLDGIFHGPLRLRTALANDYLSPAAQLVSQVGSDNILRTAQQLGITSLQADNNADLYRLLQAGGEVTLLELSQAFGVFANQGLLVGQFAEQPISNDETQKIVPITIIEVTDFSGKALLDCRNDTGAFRNYEGSRAAANCSLATRPVIGNGLAYLINHALSDETARWPSLGHPNPLEIGRPAAAKMGITSDGENQWTVGYTPNMVVGVWLGKSSAATQAEIPPLSAAGLWHAILQYGSREQAPRDWKPPPDVSEIAVCEPSGLLPTVDCPVVVNEVFLNGSEPTHPDTLYRTFQINRQTQKLATIFTPATLIKDQTYLVTPPEAEVWARSAGLPIPPDSYDLINAPSSNRDVQITSPAMFSSVRGKVAIVGRAHGIDFKKYRLQIGQGLNPQTWLQIGEDIAVPVGNGLLGYWDTHGLTGLYAIQLLVIREEEVVDTTTVQLTIDNQPPSIDLIFPSEEQRFQYPQESIITFQATASDDLDLASVEFSVDGHLITALTAPPFAVPWQTRIGVHQVSVRVIDRAGNEKEDRASFEVIR